MKTSKRRSVLIMLFVSLLPIMLSAVVQTHAQETTRIPGRWEYSSDQLSPFWLGDMVEKEPILFLSDSESGEARGSLLFPIRKIVSMHNASGDITYRENADYRFVPGTREIVIPVGSRIVTKMPEELRRPANSQQFQLTHRDGNGEILFGAKLEYHAMQTHVTYEAVEKTWPVTMPQFDARALPETLRKLREREELSVVLLGDSISTGCNASAWGEAPPFQPAYQDLLVQHLRQHYQTEVKLSNLSVGGQSTPWGITMVDQVVAHQPDLVLLAFGMNDAAGRSAEDYGQNTAEMIRRTRELRPRTEFILIAPMLGNRDWIRLNHALFPKYRDELGALCESGIALADMTSVWREFLERKTDADITGNGVNHPNDFGHRVYAQVLSAILVE